MDRSGVTERKPHNGARSQHSRSAAAPARLRWLWRVFNLLPFASALILVGAYGVNVPYADEWWLPGLFTAIARRQGVMRDLLRCNNVHPVFFPKLIWAAVAFATHWNLRVEMLATLLTILAFLILCALVANRERHGLSGWQVNLSIFVTSLLLFSFVHYDTLLWGFQLSFTLVNLAVIAAIYLLCGSTAHPIRGLILAWLCCVVASFSSLQGMLSWLVILPCLAIPFRTRRAWSIAAFGSIVLAGACLAIYFSVFSRETPLSDSAPWFRDSGQTLRFLLAVVGAPLAEGAFGAASAVAWPFGAAVFLLLGVGGLGSITGKSAWRAALPWISLGLFGLGFSAMTAIGRSSWGIHAAVTYGSRFMSGSVLVTVAAVHLVRQASAGRKWGSPAFAALAVLIGVCMLAGSAASIPIVRENKQNHLRGAACLEVLGYIDPSTDNNIESCLFSVAVPAADVVHAVRSPAELLNQLGWRKVAVHVAFVDNPATSYGYLDTTGDKPEAVAAGDWISLSGWAAVPLENRLPRFVLFAIGDERQFIEPALLGNPDRPDVAAHFHAPLLVKSGWQALLPAKLLPLGTSRLTAWAYDDRRNQFVRLNGGKLVTKH
jgi:hypothetical protein